MREAQLCDNCYLFYVNILTFFDEFSFRDNTNKQHFMVKLSISISLLATNQIDENDVMF